MEVEPLTPTNPQLAQTIEAMEERGIQMMYGRWLIEGAPRVLLIDTATGYRFLDDWKTDLWNLAGIPSPASDGETNEAIVFGYLVAWFLGEVSVAIDADESRSDENSSYRMKQNVQSSRISMSGSLVWLFLSPRNVKWI